MLPMKAVDSEVTRVLKQSYCVLGEEFTYLYAYLKCPSMKN